MEIVIALVAVLIGFIIGRVLPRERPLAICGLTGLTRLVSPIFFLNWVRMFATS